MLRGGLHLRPPALGDGLLVLDLLRRVRVVPLDEEGAPEGKEGNCRIVSSTRDDSSTPQLTVKQQDEDTDVGHR